MLKGKPRISYAEMSGIGIVFLGVRSSFLSLTEGVVLPCLGCLPSQRMYTYFNTRNFKLKFCKNQYQVINLSEAGAFKEPDLHSLDLGSNIRIFEILFSKHFYTRSLYF